MRGAGEVALWRPSGRRKTRNNKALSFTARHNSIDTTDSTSFQPTLANHLSIVWTSLTPSRNVSLNGNVRVILNGSRINVYAIGQCSCTSGTSRNFIAASHSNPSDPGCNDLLTTVYHTLVVSTLLSWSPKKWLAIDAFVAFVQSVVERLPSSSLVNSKSSNVIALGEILVDVVWSVDSELEEILADTKFALANAEQGSPNSASPAVSGGSGPAGEAALSATLEKVLKAKQNAELDKETLTILIRRLLVST